jgi:alpha-N-arabinofuranosidase
VSQIAISPARTLGTIDQKLFGGFVEHLGRCVYGGLYDEGSPLSDERGFRQDVLALLRELRLGILRWPGGNFVSNYHWTDGIGPKQHRPRRAELAWGGEEPSTFGTDEFLAYCAELGQEPDSVAPYICLNMGTGTLAEALAWVEYCNSARNTAWAAKRRANGRAAPYGVRYWALGNEMYGQWQVGMMTAEEYVREATRWARAIRMLDPGAKLVACGETGLTDWDAVVIDGLAGLVDYHSIHIYTGSADYWTNVLQPHQAERAIRTTAALIDRAAHLKGLPGKPAIAPIVTTDAAAAVQPIYYPFLLHARAALDAAVDVHVDGPVVAPQLPSGASRWPHRIADLGPFALVDAAASVSADRGKLTVTLVNRAPDAAQDARLVLRDFAFAGVATVTTLTAGDAPVPGLPPLAGVAGAHVAEAAVPVHGPALARTLPPRSFTVVEAPVAASP